MCCYLYAAWSLKTEPDNGLDAETARIIKGWQRAIVDVAIDEMPHLTLVNNLLNALGGLAHLSRPNFPVADGYHPSGLQVKLAPFTPETRSTSSISNGPRARLNRTARVSTNTRPMGAAWAGSG